ncbi:hypothetical protein GDO86_010612, partial [Hymenochirus boettgeri]
RSKMFPCQPFGTLLKFWLAVSIGLCQSGDEELADLGSGFIINTLRDQPKEPTSRPYDTNPCKMTFTIPTQDQCSREETPPVLKEEVTYLQNLLQDTNRVLQSLQYTVNADAQDLSYQEVIVEHNKGIREDNKEFHNILNKILQEFHLHMEDEDPDGTEGRKKLKRNFLTMDNLLQTSSHIAEKLDKKAKDLDAALEKQLAKSTTLVYQSTMGS